MQLQIKNQPLTYATFDRKKVGPYFEWSKTDFKIEQLRLAKLKLPVFKLLGYEKYQFICADFDGHKIPTDFLIGHEGEIASAHQAFKRYLKSKYGNKCIYLTTPSGNTKLLFIIENESLILKEDAESILSDLLDDSELMKLVDERGYTQMFLNEEMYQSFVEQINHIEINTNYLHVVHNTNICNGVTSKFNRYHQDVLELLTQCKSPLLAWINKPKRQSDRNPRIDFVSILLAARKTLKNGSQYFSQANLALDMNVSRKSIVGYFREFKKAGWLNTDGKYSYRYGFSLKYQACTDLLAIFTHLESMKRKSTNLKQLAVAPKHIDDGKWNTTGLWVIRNCFHGNKELTMNWFYSLPGWDAKPDRLKRIKSQLRHYNPKKNKTKIAA